MLGKLYYLMSNVILEEGSCVKDEAPVKHEEELKILHADEVKEYTCKICVKKYKSLATYRVHMAIHYNQFDCEVCDASFGNILYFTLHFRIHSPEDVFKCFYCDYTTPNVQEITFHLRFHKDNYRYKCDACEKPFHSLTWFQEHENFHSGAEPFACEFCDRKFMYSRYVTYHKKKVHRDKIRAKDKVVSFHECNVCETQVSTREILNEHMQSHLEDVTSSEAHSGDKPKNKKPHACQQCNRSFAQEHNLIVHMRTHTGECPFVCHYCRKGFIAMALLKVHLKQCVAKGPKVDGTKLPSEASALCDFCGKQLTSKESLKQHRRIHTGERPYSCKFCDKVCARSIELTTHMRIHTGEKPYVCEFCGKRFTQNAPRKVHVRKHTGEKPFACKLCGKGYISKGGRDLHFKKCSMLP